MTSEKIRREPKERLSSQGEKKKKKGPGEEGRENDSAWGENGEKGHDVLPNAVPRLVLNSAARHEMRCPSPS